MFVCLCRAVSSKKILNVIQDGASTVDEVTACCGAGGDCGECRSTIARMIQDEERAARDANRGCAQSQPPVDAAA